MLCTLWMSKTENNQVCYNEALNIWIVSTVFITKASKISYQLTEIASVLNRDTTNEIGYKWAINNYNKNGCL